MFQNIAPCLIDCEDRAKFFQDNKKSYDFNGCGRLFRLVSEVHT